MDARGIVFKPMREEHIQTVADIVSDAFLQREQLTKSAREKAATIRAREINLAKRAISDKVGVVAIDKNSGKVVGASLACVIDMNDDSTWYRANPPIPEEMEAIADLLDPLLEADKRFQQFRENHKKGNIPVVYLVDGAVKMDYSRRGIATGMMQESIDLGKKQGCLMALVEATGPASRGQIRKLPRFILIGGVKYSEFEYKGKKPFTHLPDSLNLYVQFLEPLEQSKL